MHRAWELLPAISTAIAREFNLLTYPLVMWFVKALVEDGVMKPSMYPVDAIICKNQEATQSKSSE